MHLKKPSQKKITNSPLMQVMQVLMLAENVLFVDLVANN